MSDTLKIGRRDLSAGKARANLGGTDPVTIFDDGSVTDANGEHMGNIYDEL